MKGSRMGLKSKLFQVSNSNTKCYFMDNKVYEVVGGNNDMNSMKESKKNHIILTLDQNIRFSVTKIDRTIKNSSFLFNIRALAHQIQLKIHQTDDLEFCIKYVGTYGIGYGLQAITENFQKVGQGNFASVFKFLSTFNTVKAMKMFEKKKLELQKNKFSFKKQVKIMRELHSPYLTRLQCIYQTDKNLYLQMEYFQETLKSYLKRPITKKKQKTIMRNLLNGLLELKELRIIHRDIKPDNIMVRKVGPDEEQFVLIDFGLAAHLSQEELLCKKCGTPGFLAPEIANMTQKTVVSEKCDIFSVGVTFFYILTNKKPFSATDPREMIQKNKKMIIEEHLFYYLSELGMFYGQGLECDLVKKMMEKDPSKRIGAKEALEHAYFNEEVDDDDVIPDEACDLNSKLKEIKIMDSSFMSEGIVLLYSIFKFTNDSCKNTLCNVLDTVCFGETQFKDLEIEDEETKSYEDEVLKGVKSSKEKARKNDNNNKGEIEQVEIQKISSNENI